MTIYFRKDLIKTWGMASVIFLIHFAGCSSGNKMIPADYTDPQSGFGAEVIIETLDGNEYSGELLSVRDSVIFTCDYYGASETDLAKGIYPVHTINTSQITLIAVKGKKLYITGMLIGAAVGGALGAALGALAYEDSQESFLFKKTSQSQCIAGGVCLLGLTGIAIGGLIGSSNSSEDRIIYDSVDPAQIDYELINRFARYNQGEPDYIKTLRNNN